MSFTVVPWDLSQRHSRAGGQCEMGSVSHTNYTSHNLCHSLASISHELGNFQSCSLFGGKSHNWFQTLHTHSLMTSITVSRQSLPHCQDEGYRGLWE
eukprot:4847279-Amphidinium_carterae.1